MSGLWKKPAFWFLLALTLRLPFVFLRHIRDVDNLAYLYLGAGFWHGFYLPLPRWLQVTMPGVPLATGWISYLPFALQDRAAFLIQALLGSLLVFPLSSLCRRRLGVEAAVWGGALAALLHPLVYVCGFFQAEPLYLLSLFAGIDALERRDSRKFGALLWLPLAALTRPEGVLVVSAAVGLWAWHARSRNHPGDWRFFSFVMLACWAVAAAWMGIFYQRFGFLPHDQYAGLNLQMALNDALGRARDPLLADPPGLGRLMGGLTALFTVLGRNLIWWGLALAGGLLGMLPALLIGIGPGGSGTSRSARGLRDPFVLLSLLSLAIFLPIWVSRHHVALVLAPLLPLVAAGAVAWRGRWPRILMAAALATGAWSCLKIGRDYNRLPGMPGPPPAESPGLRVFTNDLTLLDRRIWLGQPGIPLFAPEDSEASRARLLRDFPDIRRALIRERSPGAISLPRNWVRENCRENDPTLCFYRMQ